MKARVMLSRKDMTFTTQLFGVVVEYHQYVVDRRTIQARAIHFYIEDDEVYHHKFTIDDFWLPDLIAIATKSILHKPKKAKKK